MAVRAIPTYELYGELLAGRFTDPVHLEEIRERSREYDWTIRLHRHKSLAQVFLFRSPGVSLRIAEATHTATEPLVLFVPPGTPHGFRFDEDVSGEVLSLRMEEMKPGLADLLTRPELQAAGILPSSRCANFTEIESAFAQLRRCYQGMTLERTDLLHALARIIAVYISGDLRRETALRQAPRSEQLTRHEAQADRFCSLVEQSFAEDMSVADYAGQIGVSAPHLTRVCRNVLGATPNGLIRQRRLLEAKRLLEYTRLSVAEIAHRAGFRDPSFFSRTFSQTFGLSPRDYRAETDS